jgi:hypothetical protein
VKTTTSSCLALVLIGVSVLAGCEPRRSAEAFCRTLAEEKQRHLDKYSEREDKIVDKVREGDLSSLLSVAVGSSSEAIQDMTVTFHKLEKVAPEEILPDVEALGDALERQQEVLKDLPDNPVGALTDSLTSAAKPPASPAPQPDQGFARCVKATLVALGEAGVEPVNTRVDVGVEDPSAINQLVPDVGREAIRPLDRLTPLLAGDLYDR